MHRPRVIFLVALLLSLGAMAALWMTAMPLGVPGEWVWERIPWGSADRWDFLLGGGLVFAAGGIFAGIVRQGAGRIDSASPISLGGWLLALALAGFCWLFAVQLCPPEGYGIAKSAWVLYFPASSGYFDEARHRPESLGEYLANYEADIQSQDSTRRVLHHGTHPPGLFISYRGLIWLCESSPKLTRVLLSTQPASVSAMFDEIEKRSKSTGRRLRDTDRAVIWLATLLTMMCGALVTMPLFFLARGIASARSAWIASAFWPLIPALAVFLPKSDVLLAFLGISFLAVWTSGWRRRCFLRCFLAGGMFWLGLMFSLALLPVAFLAALMTGWDVVFSERPPSPKSIIKSVSPLLLAGVLGFLLSVVLVGWFTHMNLFAVWWQNFQNHAEFYRHFQRSYWPWFWVNPVETFFAVGAPICVLSVAAIARHWKDRKSSSLASWGPDFAFVTTLAVLWISGKNRGEAARLWLVIFPYFVWISARFWDRPASAERSWRPTMLLPMLVLQMLVCWLTVIRVNGFPL